MEYKIAIPRHFWNFPPKSIHFIENCILDFIFLNFYFEFSCVWNMTNSKICFRNDFEMREVCCVLFTSICIWKMLFDANLELAGLYSWRLAVRSNNHANHVAIQCGYGKCLTIWFESILRFFTPHYARVELRRLLKWLYVRMVKGSLDKCWRNLAKVLM